MPLPTNPRQPWPPTALDAVYDEMREHAAWYAASPQQLANFYSSASYTPTPTGHIWARETRERLLVAVHMPLASDLAQMSSDLLFSEMPDMVVSHHPTTQQRLEQLIENGNIMSRLLEGAETCSALGGVYMRVVWDAHVTDEPMLTIMQPDTVVPEFAWGMLRAVTFWRVIAEEAGKYGQKDSIWRHLERHELDAQGNGVILHGVYKGTRDELGVAMPLTSFAELATLEPIILTHMPGLDVWYIPNMLPNRRNRGSAFGVSDYQGKESLFASLDEAWTSLITELQLCKVRIFVPEEYLQRLNGTARFAIDDQLFVPLNIDPMAAQQIDIKIQQPDLRVEKHLQLTQNLVRDIVTRCGYAPQTFGLDIDGNAPSGTALRIRERRSLTTMAKKQRYWKTPLQQMLRSLLYLDATVFDRPHPIPDSVAVTFADSVAPDPTELATTVNLLKQSESASEYIRLKTLHPDWTDQDIGQEQVRIREDKIRGLQLMSAVMGDGDPTGGVLDRLDTPKNGADRTQ